MSLTVAATRNPHTQMIPMPELLCCDPRCLSSSESAVTGLAPWSFYPNALSTSPNLVNLWFERPEAGQTSGDMVEWEANNNSGNSLECKPEENDGLELSLSLGRPSRKFTGKMADNNNSAVSCEKVSDGSSSTTLSSIAPNCNLHEATLRTKVGAERDGSFLQQAFCGNENELFPEQLYTDAMPHDWKQECLHEPRLTAAQIWHNIQKSSSLPKMVMATTVGGATEAVKSNASTNSWKHRSASMQLFDPSREGRETTSLLRSTSNKLQQFVNRQPFSLTREISCKDPFRNNNSPVQQDDQQEKAQELQRKKEMQAQRKQEARKRRKSLIEEKQQKKRAKEEERKFLSPRSSCITNNSSPMRTHSASPAMQDTDRSLKCASGGPQRMGSEIWGYSDPFDISSGGAVKGPGRARDHEEQRFSWKTEEKYAMKADKNVAGGGKIVQERSKSTAVPTVQSNNRKSKARYTGEANKASLNEIEVKGGGSPVKMITFGDHQSNSSKSNSRDEPMLGTQSHLKDQEASSQRSAMESDISTQTVANISLYEPSAVTSTLAYAAASLPLLPMPYPFSMPVSPTPGVPLQMGLPIPYFMQLFPPHFSSGPKDNLNPTCSQLLPPFRFPLGCGLTSYNLPIPEACIPWFPVTHAPILSSSAKSIHGSTEPDRGSFNGIISGTEAKDAELQNLLHPMQVYPSANQAKSQGVFAPLSRKLPDIACDASSQIALKQLGLIRTVSESGVQFGCTRGVTDSKSQFSLNRTVSDSGAQLGRSGERIRVRDRSEDPFSCKLIGDVETPERTFSIETPAQKRLSAVRSPHCEGKGSNMAAKESSAPSNPLDPIVSEVFSSSEANASVAVEENMKDEACKPQQGVSSGGKSGVATAFPDLPRVYTIGPPPNWRTVTGVMYILDKHQVKIVCNCHGMHMSSGEFVQHAGHTDLSNPERNILVNPVPCVS